LGFGKRIAVFVTLAFLCLPLSRAVADAGLPVETHIVVTGSTYIVGDDNVSMDQNNPQRLPEVHVTQGQKLFLTNLDLSAHSLISKIYDSDGSAIFESPAPGVNFRTTAEILGVPQLAANTYGFYCALHPGMEGTLIVDPPIGG
jgi:plastocyanin